MNKLFLVVAILLASSVAGADSLSVNASVSENSLPSYGLDLEKDIDFLYVDLQSMFSADKQSNTTTVAGGINLFSVVNLGILGGYKIDRGASGGVLGAEVGFEASLSKRLFLKENNQVTRNAGDHSISGSATVGFGINL